MTPAPHREEVTPPPGPRRDPAARSQLEEGGTVYELALGLSDRLDEADLDLWAAGVRACLDAPSSTARQRHLAVELTRLRDMAAVRRSGLQAEIAEALAQLALGLGSLDLPTQPLYDALRGLAEHLELHGGRRWLARLRTVVGEEGRVPAGRLQRLAAVLSAMTPGVPGLPEDTGAKVAAVCARLARVPDAEDALTYIVFALRPPQPSRRLAAEGAPGGR